MAAAATSPAVEAAHARLQRITPAPIISLRPLTGLTFNRQLANTTSDPLTVTLSNIGDADLPIAIEIVGPAADFTQTNNCRFLWGHVATANAGEIVVRLKPGGSGVRSASLNVANADGGGAFSRSSSGFWRVIAELPGDDKR